MVVIPTVMHTGSLFVTDNIFRDFKKYKPNETPEEDSIVFWHVQHFPVSEFAKHINGRNIVIPLRRLERIIVSWERRGKPLRHLDQSLDILMEFDQYEPYYLPIDHEDRDRYFEEMKNGLGLDLKTDWKYYNLQHFSHNATYEDITDKKRADRLIEKHSPFFNRFYSI